MIKHLLANTPIVFHTRGNYSLPLRFFNTEIVIGLQLCTATPILILITNF